MNKLVISAGLALAFAAVGAAQAQAQAQAQNAAAGEPLFHQIEALPKRELWIDSGFATYHFNRNRDLNGGNRGLGLEYRFTGTLSAAAGRFVNSDREYSNYAGVIWQPYALGPLRLGAAIAGFNGYPHMREGGWFPAVIPTVTYEYKRVGVNVGIIPSYKDRLYGGISLQLKLKLFE